MAIKYQARDHYAKFPEQTKGKHLWIMAGMWRVTPPLGDEVHMDMENLLSIDGPGCFWCEQTWKPGMENTPCKG